MVWFGLAWLGLAWLGLAWLGLAWLGLAWQIVLDRSIKTIQVFHVKPIGSNLCESDSNPRVYKEPFRPGYNRGFNVHLHSLGLFTNSGE
ncbi:hypothetical protein BZG72_11885 [Salinivibrio sp. PR6]|nr:hypothetical protein BZG72_11885 [Salinivibrio sp. PR6]